MIVYRIGKTKYADDLNGIGSKLYGGRWNHEGISCLYTSESRALALLEYSVNSYIYDIPRALSITTIDIGSMHFRKLTESELPGDWKKFPAPVSTKDFGTSLLKTAGTAILKVPSTIIPQEFNYLLNPLHPDRSDFRILDIQDFVYELRIKTT